MSESAVDTVLIVDDEDPVRKTFRDWLAEADLGCRVLTAGDAAAALKLANEHVIDLAVLDWNLGAGNDGLQLLEDLIYFNANIVAIMVTGYAHQATPLHAMRSGVRDYLDKNQELNKATFVAAVEKQLALIRPAKNAHRITQGLMAFRSAVEQVLPLVQSAAALNDPVPLPQAVRSLFRFLLAATGAADGAIIVRSYDDNRDPPEVCRAYNIDGREVSEALVPYTTSLAFALFPAQQPHATGRLEAVEGIQLQPFEQGRVNSLLAPLDVAPGIQVVLELFDKQGQDGRPTPFDEADHRLTHAASDFASELLRQALAERRTNRILADAVESALRIASDVRGQGSGVRGQESEIQESPPADVMAQLQTSLASSPGTIDAAATLRLAEAIRVLAVRHGPRAVEHCTRLVEDLRGLLDGISGEGGS